MPRNQPSEDLIGQKFNFLTITGFQHDAKTREWLMAIQCDCGNVGRDVLRKLKNGQRKTCGIKGCPHFHVVRKTNGRNGNFTGHEDIYGSRWKLWQIGAEKRGISFDITPEYAWEVFIQQKRRCALSGCPLEFGTAWNKKITASLDRIDSSKGYIVGNVQWVHKHVNLMKRSESDEDFISWCRMVVEHRGTATNAG